MSLIWFVRLILIFHYFNSDCNSVSADSTNNSVNRRVCIPQSNRDYSFSEKLRQDRDNNVSCDFTILVEGYNYTAHKLVLKVNSQYFDNLFNENIDDEFDFLKLENVSRKHYELLSDYIYGKPFDFIDCPLKDIALVCDLADQWILQTFKEDCSDFVTNWDTNGTFVKRYDMAKQFKMETEIKEMTETIHKYFFTNPKDFNSTDFSIQLKNVPYEFLPKAVSLIKTDQKFLRALFYWLLSQPVEEFDRYFNLIFLDVHFEKIKVGLINSFFSEFVKSKSFKMSQILRLQLAVQELTTPKRVNVFGGLPNWQLFAAIMVKNTNLKVSLYEPLNDIWHSKIYSFLFYIREIFVNQNRLFLFDQDFNKDIIKPLSYAILDLDNQKQLDSFSGLLFCVKPTNCRLISIFADKSKIYFLIHKSGYAELNIHDIVSKETIVHQMSKTQSTLYGYSSLIVKNEMVYYAAGRHVYSYNPFVGNVSNTMIGSLRTGMRGVPKSLLTNDNELIFIDSDYLHYVKTNVSVKHSWEIRKVDLSDKGVFVMTPLYGDDEIYISFYDHEDLKRNHTKKRVFSYVAKSPYLDEGSLKYFFKSG